MQILRCHKVVVALGLSLTVLTGCSVDEVSSNPNTSPTDDLEACIVQVSDYARTGAGLDVLGRAVGQAADGSAAYLVKADWHLNGRDSLVMREPANEVTLSFFRTDGTPASDVEFSNFRLVMDMGAHAHTTDECPAKMPEINRLNANTVNIRYINFVMASRTINKWFFYKLTAKVDGREGSVARFDIPFKVM